MANVLNLELTMERTSLDALETSKNRVSSRDSLDFDKGSMFNSTAFITTPNISNIYGGRTINNLGVPYSWGTQAHFLKTIVISIPPWTKVQSTLRTWE